MIFYRQKIKDLILIKSEPYTDRRGLFRRVFCSNELKVKKINFKIKQVNISGQWPLGSGWSSVARYQYDLEEHEEIESLAGLNYDAGCWTSSVLFNRIPLATNDKDNYTLFFMIELGGLGAIETGGSGALQEALNRNVPGAYLSRDLPNNYRAKYLR